MRAIGILAAPMLFSASAQSGDSATLLPVIDGDWWRIAGDPDLGEYSRPEQQPVDFSIWRAADGTWQLWSCIRGTACGGNTRLFYRWEGNRITDPDWEPKGIVMRADPAFGETPGGLQAPHVVRVRQEYLMAYGDWNHICFAASRDGREFTRRLRPDGSTGVFGEGEGANTRDPMLLFTNDLWYCYYTAHPGRKGSVFCRTSPDLEQWSDFSIVASGGSAGHGPSSAECPHVVEPVPGLYFLLRTQRYGEDAQTCVYRSADPRRFGIDDDSFLVARMPIAAPEIILHEREYYIASLLPSLKGIRIARLRWERR